MTYNDTTPTTNSAVQDYDQLIPITIDEQAIRLLATGRINDQTTWADLGAILEADAAEQAALREMEARQQ